MTRLRLGHLNGALLQSARESSGFSLEEIARAANLKDTEAVLGLEAGEIRPTLSQAEGLAHKFQRPLAYFYLQSAPNASASRIVDNRSPSRATDFSPKTLLALRRIHLVQSSASEIQALLGQPSPELPHIERSWNIQDSASVLRGWLGLDASRNWLLRTVALSRLIGNVERSGVSVLQLAMPTLELQGASSLDPYPVVLLNHSDYVSSKIFTLVHEVAHLALRVGGLCVVDPAPTHEIERLCNRIAGETLVPRNDLDRAMESVRQLDDDSLRDLADRFSVSREVVLLRLIELGKLPASEWDACVPRWRSEARMKSKGQPRTPAPASLAIRENGQRFTSLVFSGETRGVISQADASRSLRIGIGVLEDLRQRR